jgi:hypothetical protein
LGTLSRDKEDERVFLLELFWLSMNILSWTAVGFGLGLFGFGF